MAEEVRDMSQSYDAARFDETFGALKRCINSLVSQAYAEAALGPTQVRVLRHIGKHAPISQAEIARATATDPALTGRALQALIEREWVLRERSAEDRRQYLLKLGAAGQRALKHIEMVRARLVERIVDPLDQRDLADFQRIAGKLLAAFAPSAASAIVDER
jgi:DNA-binding MarR family transcriptional regulator